MRARRLSGHRTFAKLPPAGKGKPSKPHQPMNTSTPNANAASSMMAEQSPRYVQLSALLEEGKRIYPTIEQLHLIGPFEHSLAAIEQEMAEIRTQHTQNEGGVA
jgi:hypothetical protein